MKRLLLTVALLTGTVPALSAQTARDTATTSYSVNGVKVIHRRTNTSIVVTNLYLLGGARQLTPATAGIETFLLAVTERGTKGYPRDVLRRAMARTGSEIIMTPKEDWTLFGLRTTTAELDSAWAIFADRVMRPNIDTTDVEFVREQLVTGIRQRADSPDATLDYLADSIVFAGSPFAVDPIGSVQSVSKLSAAQLRAYHKAQFVTSRVLMVVVGDVSRSKVESLVRNSIGKLPAGTYEWAMPDTLPTRKPDVVNLRRPLPTNYLQGYVLGPPANSPDAAPLRVASAVLSGRLFAEIRSKRNLTYAVASSFRDHGLTTMGLYVTTTDPEQTVGLMRSEVRALQDNRVETSQLRPLIQQFITEYFLDNETITAQADFLARNQLYRGDFRAGERFVQDLRNVTGADIQRVMRRYFHNIRWAYIGDPSKIRRERLLDF
jgi:zinc protease